MKPPSPTSFRHSSLRETSRLKTSRCSSGALDGDRILVSPPNLGSCGFGELSWRYVDEAFSGLHADSLRGSVDSIRVIPTPVPATSWLLLSAFAALGGARRRFRAESAARQ